MYLYEPKKSPNGDQMSVPSGLTASESAYFDQQFAELKKKIEWVIKTQKIGATQRNRLKRLLDAESKIKRNLGDRLSFASTRQERREYIDGSLRVFEDAIRGFVDMPGEPTKLEARLRRTVRARAEEIEKKIHRFQRDPLTKKKEMKALSELANSIRNVYRMLDALKRDKIGELRKLEAKVSTLETKTLTYETKLKVRTFLRRIGAPLAHHNIFDRVEFEKVIKVHKEWRKKPVSEIAKDTGLDESEVIAIARALGWPVIPESLEWWKSNFPNARVGDAVDVTDFEIDGINPLRQTRSRLINMGLAEGKRIFAVPIYNARGGFKKWDLEYGEIAIDLEGRHEITASPAGVVAALLCARGENKGNIGFDELEHVKTGSIEGINSDLAYKLHSYLNLSESDTYILMVRNPDDIESDVRHFAASLSEIVAKGAQTRIFFGALPGHDEWNSLKHQSHPLIRDEVMEIHYANQSRKKRNTLGPTFHIVPRVNI